MSIDRSLTDKKKKKLSDENDQYRLSATMFSKTRRKKSADYLDINTAEGNIEVQDERNRQPNTSKKKQQRDSSSDNRALFNISGKIDSFIISRSFNR